MGTNDEVTNKTRDDQTTKNSQPLNASASTVSGIRANVSFEVRGEGTSVQLPDKSAKLKHPDDDAVSRFRKRFIKYTTVVNAFNERNDTGIQPLLKPLVDQSVWKQLSRRYLNKTHQTRRQDPPDDERVKQYIMREGDYANVGRDKPFVRDPIQALKGLVWSMQEKTFERRLAAYISK